MLEEGLAGSINDALDQPFDLALTIMEMRAYAQVKALVENAKSDDDLPDIPMVQTAKDMIGRAAQAEIERRKARQRGRT